MKMYLKWAIPLFFLLVIQNVWTQSVGRRLGNFREVFAWKQLTFNINGNHLLQDRSGSEDLEDRQKRQADEVFFDEDNGPRRNWNQNNGSSRPRPNNWNNKQPSTTTVRPADEVGRFFVQYNNVPMGMEKVGNRLFVSIPRRRYGIPATLNYIDLARDSNTRSPALTPYPNLRVARSLISVYRTRADRCGRLWMVDTGLMEIPNSPRQVLPPAIVVFDLQTNKQIFRYPFKASDIPAADTPTGLASITVDVIANDCSNTFAYVPDLTTFGIIVFSLKENDSWRLSHNFFSFNPVAGSLNVAGHQFQWSDGVFSITLNEPAANSCRTAYFHPLISTQEFSVSTCVLRNRTASSDSNYWQSFSLVGERGPTSQSTMHEYDPSTSVIFYADIGRNAVSCWRTSSPMTPSNVAIVAQDSVRMSYPSDLHVTDGEVWVMANTLPRFGYSRLDVDEFNFYIYRGSVEDLISGTVCARRANNFN